MVVLYTGRNDIATASVKLAAPSGITFTYTEAEVVGNGNMGTSYHKTGY